MQEHWIVPKSIFMCLGLIFAALRMADKSKLLIFGILVLGSALVNLFIFEEIYNKGMYNHRTNEDEITSKTYEPRRIVHNVNCLKIFEADEAETAKARQIKQTKPPDDDIFRIPKNCSVLKSWGYQLEPLSEEEEHFPIAISILMHADVYQFEHLFRLIYQPQNVYCVHVDRKAKAVVLENVKAMVNCFPNLYIADNLLNVSYWQYSRLQADLNCMSDLLNKDKSWKYLINIAGTVLPLRTNREMVKILKIYNGSNDIEGQDHKDWWRGKRIGPHKITILKGSAYNIYSRAFMEWTFNATEPRDFLKWIKEHDSRKFLPWSVDEHYWASLNHLKPNPQLKTPGGYTGKLENKPALSSFSFWHPWGDCKGTWSPHNICLLGVADLPALIDLKVFFANKFDYNRDELAGKCLEELLRNRTRISAPMSDVYYYKTLPFVRR